MFKNKNIIVIGASSELAQEFLSINKLDNNFHTISQNKNFNHDGFVVNNYIEEIDKIVDYVSNIKNVTIIFFNGFLAENRPYKFPNQDEIEKTFTINYLVPFKITEKILHRKLKVEKFVYLSSFAAVKPRYKNFIYGYSKKLLEETIKGMELNNYLFFRFGKINTSMSLNHRSSFFDLEVNQAAKVLSKSLFKKSGVIYSSFIIKLISLVVKILPASLLKYLKI